MYPAMEGRALDHDLLKVGLRAPEVKAGGDGPRRCRYQRLS